MNNDITLRKYVFAKIKEHKKEALSIVVLIAISIVLFVGIRCFATNHGKYVKVYVNDKLTKTFKLDSDIRYMIETKKGYNFLIIKNNHAKIVDADCPNKICVDKGYISEDNESIICVPHNVVVTVDSDKEASVDAVAD